jgi:hypothetical protein
MNFSLFDRCFKLYAHMDSLSYVTFLRLTVSFYENNDF